MGSATALLHRLLAGAWTLLQAALVLWIGYHVSWGLELRALVAAAALGIALYLAVMFAGDAPHQGGWS